jgi:hypothetical protein
VSGLSQALDRRTIQFVTSLSRFSRYSVVILGLFSAAAATQSVAALMLDFSNSLRACAKDVEAINIAAMPRVAGRHLVISISKAIGKMA